MPESARFPAVDNFVLVEDRFTRPFWEAARQHRLMVMHCGDCGRFRMPPSPFCPDCRSQNSQWTELSGSGTIYSYTIVPPRKGEDGEGPLVPALIETEEAPGIRIVSNIVRSRVADISVGRTVRLVWQDRSDGLSFPRFEVDGD